MGCARAWVFGWGFGCAFGEERTGAPLACEQGVKLSDLPHACFGTAERNAQSVEALLARQSNIRALEEFIKRRVFHLARELDRRNIA